MGFYRAKKAQGLSDDLLPYVAPLTPWSPLMSLTIGILALVFVGFDVFSPEFSVRGFVTSYFGLIFAIVMFGVGRVLFRLQGRSSEFVDPKEADLWSGKAECDAECRHWEEGGIEENEKARLAEMSALRRAWERCW